MRWLAVPIALASHPGVALGQEPERHWSTVRGSIWDSLSAGPLVGARVSLLGVARTTLTDDRGRFVLDSVPDGRRTVTWSHPGLDSLGLSGFSAVLLVPPGHDTTLVLAVPSHATLRHKACGATVAEGADTGLIRGRVRDAESGAPLPGALVTFSLLSPDSGEGLRVEQRGYAAAADQAGWYRLCAVPVGPRLGVRARHGTSASGLIEVAIGARGMTRQDLSVSREAALDSIGRLRRGSATLVGRAVGDRGGVLPGVLVAVDGVPGGARSDSAGAFVLRGLPAGTQMLVVRRVGYFASRLAVELRGNDTTRVTVPMHELIVLDTLRVVAGYGFVRGTVYDSLLHSPLGNATVTILGGVQRTVTDSRGRFMLRGVPVGRQVVTFSHPDLDSIGLSTFGGVVTVAPNTEMALPLAVPSHDTFWRAVCGSARRPGADSGIVFGRMTDAETRVPIAGARASVQWVTVYQDSLDRWIIDHPRSVVETDAGGWYYVCGVPAEYLAWARAQVDSFSSGLAEVLVDIRGIARRDLSVSREVVQADADTSAAPHRHGLATVIGTVRGERGGLLPGSFASVDDVPGMVEVDGQGQFVLKNLPSGSDMLMVRRIGYFGTRTVVDLANRDTTSVSVRLLEATVLDTMRVFATPRLANVIEEIDYRRRSGFGYFKGPSEIRQYVTMRSLFDGIPSVVTVSGPSVFSFVIGVRSVFSMPGPLSRPAASPGAEDRMIPGVPAPVMLPGYCRPPIYIDGFAADEEVLSSLTPAQVVALEVYPRPTAALGRYAGFSNCGVVLVWTWAGSS